MAVGIAHAAAWDADSGVIAMARNGALEDLASVTRLLGIVPKCNAHQSICTFSYPDHSTVTVFFRKIGDMQREYMFTEDRLAIHQD
jgi:hypothetical protein